MSRKPRILSTKVLSKELAHKLEDSGMTLDMNDFIEIENYTESISASSYKRRQIIITSQNSVAALINLGAIQNLQNKRIMCVGSKTERMLMSEGVFVSQKYKNSAELAEDAVGIEVGTTFFTGKRRMPVIEKVFNDARVELDVVELYNSVLTPVKVDDKYEAVMFFSPSGVESFFKVNKLRGALAICIGATTERAVRKFTENTSIAEVTTVESVVDATLEQMMSYEK
jgi:uroporphyrinogen-III synthase